MGSLLRRAHVQFDAQNFLSGLEAFNGPPKRLCERRVTLDLHTRALLGDIEGTSHMDKTQLSGRLP
eukprot:8128045-Prorocentrum_lima.AAC.1